MRQYRKLSRFKRFLQRERDGLRAFCVELANNETFQLMLLVDCVLLVVLWWTL